MCFTPDTWCRDRAVSVILESPINFMMALLIMLAAGHTHRLRISSAPASASFNPCSLLPISSCRRRSKKGKIGFPILTTITHKAHAFRH